MEPIDVVMLTKNSEYVLEKCLQSIYHNVPVNRLIVIDGFSTDKTLKILERYRQKYRNIHVMLEKGTRAVARQKGIENVETEWFMFIDSDVVLSKGWFRKAWKLINDKVGAVWGVDIPANIKHPTLLRVFTEVSMRSFRVRGGTHDTLIRYDAVKGIRIPENLHVYEDAFIKNWIINRGYKVVATYNPYCRHYRPPEDWSLKQGIFLASLEIKHGFLRHHTFFYVYAALYWFLQGLITRFSEHSKGVLKINK